jgi:NitT/TauT family transport system ATP-binding protein
LRIAAVELKSLSLSYPLPNKERTWVVRDVSARFEEGAISAIIGPSGCGKTSLIRMMAGLLKPDGGTILIEGDPVRGVRKHTAVIFQDYGLLPWETVRVNAELPLRIAGVRGPRRKAVRDLLVQFGLGAFEKRYPHQLSGGMKQRLAIVRALIAEPRLLLMDEPFSGLDALTREDAQDFLLGVQKERRLTIVMVTHSIEEAVYMADSVYVMRGLNPGILDTQTGISRDGASHARFRGEARFREYNAALRSALKGSDL